MITESDAATEASDTRTPGAVACSAAFGRRRWLRGVAAGPGLSLACGPWPWACGLWPRAGARAAEAAGTADLPVLKPGDAWTYRKLNGFNGEMVEEYRLQFLGIDPAGGHDVFLYATLKTVQPALEGRRGRYLLVRQTASPPAETADQEGLQKLQFPLQVGKTWSYRFHQGRHRESATAEVTAATTLTVPAGRFETLRVEHRGDWLQPEAGGAVERTVHYAPGARMPVSETLVMRVSGSQFPIGEKLRWELIGLDPAPASGRRTGLA